MPDKITIGLYSIQSGRGFNPAALHEIRNITRIQEGFSAAARRVPREEPEIIVSVLLIPDWKKGSSYDNADYQVARKAFLEAFQSELNKAGLSAKVKLEDFSSKPSLSQEERGYLNGLTARGSNADMIKTHAIISATDCNHLQLDSNTQIHDFAGLYNATFAAKTQSDALNASYYDIDYVSAHNKIVYTTPTGPLVSELKKIHLKYCDAHRDDHLSNDENTRLEKSEKNSTYSKDFVVALDHLHLTSPLQTLTGKVVHPAHLDKVETF